MKKFVVLIWVFTVLGVNLYSKDTLIEKAEKEFQLGGTYYENKNYLKSKKFLKKACDSGNSGGCIFLGIMYQNKQGVPQDYNKAVELYQKACNNGDNFGCNKLGFMYEYGKGVSQDYNKAEKLYQKVCDSGYDKGCLNLENIRYNKKILEFYKKACDGGDATRCYGLGLIYKNGEEIKRSLPNATKYFKKSCDNGDTIGCIYAGGLIKEIDKSIEYYDKSCQGGCSPICSFIGGLYATDEKVKNLPKAIKYFKQACLKEDMSGCMALKAIELLSPLIPLSKSKTFNQSMEIFVISIDKILKDRDAEEYFNLGLIHNKNKEYSKAKKYYGRACQDGYSKGCYYLGLIHNENQEYSKAKKYYEKACQGGYMKGCNKVKKKQEKIRSSHHVVRKNIFKQETYDALYQKIRKELITWKKKHSNWEKNKVTIKFKVFCSGKMTFSIIHKSNNHRYNQAIYRYILDMRRHLKTRHDKSEPYEIEISL